MKQIMEMPDEKQITIIMKKVEQGCYFCQGQRLAFDLPWAIYVVNHDLVIPYYRIYINDVYMGGRMSEQDCYDYLKNLSREGAHIAEM